MQIEPLKLDEETQKENAKAQEWEIFVKGEGWQEAKRRLLNKVADIDSISVMREEFKGDNEALLRAIEARQMTVNIILEWIGEIDGSAEVTEDNREMMAQSRKDDIIRELK